MKEPKMFIILLNNIQKHIMTYSYQYLLLMKNPMFFTDNDINCNLTVNIRRTKPNQNLQPNG